MGKQDQDFWDTAALTVALSDIAYSEPDQAIGSIKSLGFKTVTYMDNDNAEGYLAANARIAAIIFRGTQPQQLKDLLADLNAVPKRHGPGYVHAGFRREARKLYDMVMAFAHANRGKRFLVTGHSLGAAMATYTAQELRWAGFENIELWTYGSPRLGSIDYVTGMDVVHHRWRNCNDVIPTVPFWFMGFRHHGDLHYINYYGNTRRLSTWQSIKDHWRGHWRALRKGQMFDGIYDHGIKHYRRKIERLRERNLRDTDQRS